MKLSNARNAQRTKGTIIALMGTIVLSFDAVLVRLAGVSAGDAAFWRGTLIAISLTLFLCVTRNLSQFNLLRNYGRVALVVCGVYASNTALFVFSVSHTRVANTMAILCCTPLFSAIFSWFLLRERIAFRYWITIFSSIIGVIIIFTSSVNTSNWIGDSLALVLSLSTAFLFTYLRGYPNLPRIPSIALGALVSALVIFPFTSAFSIPLLSIGWLALMGLIQMPVASVAMMTATRYLPSPELSVFLLLEIMLAPAWVWLFVNETVPLSTFFGGAIVIASVAVHCWYEIKSDKKNIGPTPT